MCTYLPLNSVSTKQLQGLKPGLLDVVDHTLGLWCATKKIKIYDNERWGQENTLRVQKFTKSSCRFPMQYIEMLLQSSRQTNVTSLSRAFKWCLVMSAKTVMTTTALSGRNKTFKTTRSPLILSIITIVWYTNRIIYCSLCFAKTVNPTNEYW